MNNKTEYILCAAIKRKSPRQVENNPYHEGVNDILNIEIGYRHHDIFIRFKDELDRNPSAQGFYTSLGRFVDRYEAMKIAEESGQVSIDRSRKINLINDSEIEYRKVYNQLFSEDLY